MESWINEHLNLLANDKTEEAKHLLLSKIPRKLYKYRCLNKYTIDALKKNAIWMCNVTALNDPYECYPKLDAEIAIELFFTSSGFKQGFKSQFNKELKNDDYEKILSAKDKIATYKNIAKFFNITAPSRDEVFLSIENMFREQLLSIREELFLCSFSQIFDSVIMWSHYADEHKGICIEYDFTQFKQIDDLKYLYPVVYTDELYDFTPLFNGKSGNKLLSHATLHKGKDWQYEKEWRITYPNKVERSEPGFLVRGPKPTAIYLGSKFTQNDHELKKQLINFAKAENIVIHEMQMDTHKYRIVKAK